MLCCLFIDVVLVDSHHFQSKRLEQTVFLQKVSRRGTRFFFAEDEQKEEGAMETS